MAVVTFTYITYNHNGTGVRHHHFTSSNDLTSLPSHNFPGSSDSSPGSDSAFAPATWGSLPFAFMSINGAVGGNKLYTSAGNQSFMVGSSNVAVLVVYAPESTPGPDGGPGIWVDAFNVNTGMFSDDINFIQVLTPPTPPDNPDSGMTTYANWEGVISTNNAEHMRASNTVDSGVPFLEWKQIIPPDSISNLKDQDIAQGQSNQIWFAFYQTPTPPNWGRIDDKYRAYDWLWWLHSWWGHGPDPGPDQRVWIQQYMAAMDLSQIAQRVPPEVRTMVLQAAYKQVSLSLESIKGEMSGTQYQGEISGMQYRK